MKDYLYKSKLILLFPRPISLCPLISWPQWSSAQITPKACIHLPHELELITSIYYRGVCTNFSGKNHRRFRTKYFFNLLDFVVHACVCDQYPGHRASTNLEKCTNPKWARCPQFSEPGTLPHANPPKQSRKITLLPQKQ